MSKAATSHRWFPGRRANPQPVDMDPADLGTAFGLDMSLNEIGHEPPVTVAPALRQSGWMGRLTFRRKPAT